MFWMDGNFENLVSMEFFTSAALRIPMMMSFPSLSPTRMWLLLLVTVTHWMGTRSGNVVNVLRLKIHTSRVLTHLPLDKMAAVLADDIYKCIFLNENVRIPIQISLKLVPRIPTENKASLVQVIAWHRTGDKPLPEPMVTQSTDAYMQH